MGWFNITDYSKYIGKRYGKLTILEVWRDYENKVTYAKAKCDCGNIIKTKLKYITSGDKKSCGCLKPGVKKLESKNMISLSGFKIGKITVTTPSDKRSSNGSVMWNYICECGGTGTACVSDIKRGQITSCGCKKAEHRVSKYETFVEDILTNKKIKFIKEFCFEDCKNQRKLPFDFYLPDYNLCIECQGQQHYFPVEYFGGEDEYKKTVYRDKIKKNYCENNNIELLYIPYTMNKEEIQLELSKKLTP